MGVGVGMYMCFCAEGAAVQARYLHWIFITRVGLALQRHIVCVCQILYQGLAVSCPPFLHLLFMTRSE